MIIRLLAETRITLSERYRQLYYIYPFVNITAQETGSLKTTMTRQIVFNAPVILAILLHHGKYDDKIADINEHHPRMKPMQTDRLLKNRFAEQFARSPWIY